jgi:hypothetical protein
MYLNHLKRLDLAQLHLHALTKRAHRGREDKVHGVEETKYEFCKEECERMNACVDATGDEKKVKKSLVEFFL